MIKANNPKILSLQVFRGLAALAVIFFHCAQRGDIQSPLLQIPLLGYLGVDFFFVLSGFIIMYAHLKDPHTFAATKKYILKRVTRIYPAYLPIGLAVYFLAASSGPAHASFLSTLFLIPANKPVALPQAWTLVHEMMFYCIFLLFFISWRFLLSGLLVWAAVICISTFSYRPMGWLLPPLSWINLEFMLGVGAAGLFHFYHQQLAFHKGKITILGMFTFMILLSVLVGRTNGVIALRLMFACSLVFLIIGFALYEYDGKIHWPKPLLLIGNASYSLYLIHFSVIAITFKILSHYQARFATMFISGFALSLVVGLLYYFTVERPFIYLAQKYFKRNTPCH